MIQMFCLGLSTQLSIIFSSLNLATVNSSKLMVMQMVLGKLSGSQRGKKPVFGRELQDGAKGDEREIEEG